MECGQACMPVALAARAATCATTVAPLGAPSIIPWRSHCQAGRCGFHIRRMACTLTCSMCRCTSSRRRRAGLRLGEDDLPSCCTTSHQHNYLCLLLSGLSRCECCYLPDMWRGGMLIRLRSGHCRVLDLGCGSGIWGLILARLAPENLTVHTTFADIDARCVSTSLWNAIELNGVPADSCTGLVGNMFDAVPATAPLFDLIVFNPPQTGGDARLRAVRPDKWGGDDGSLFYRRLAAESPRYLDRQRHNSGGTVAAAHIGLAAPRRVHAAFGALPVHRSAYSPPPPYPPARVPGCAPGWLAGCHQLMCRAASAGSWLGMIPGFFCVCS